MTDGNCHCIISNKIGSNSLSARKIPGSHIMHMYRLNVCASFAPQRLDVPCNLKYSLPVDIFHFSPVFQFAFFNLPILELLPVKLNIFIREARSYFHTYFTVFPDVAGTFFKIRLPGYQFSVHA